ncbi:DUF72 domain-containing protein [Aestuariibacter sp. A3R04]|uniref:DUF72 domain-containing protein n=1 Tax=Aestuariibacter sp. A3R04 TaxID=2841571 RepID=UPI001C099C92|nr:DUF72 domain-containing protein [Aestuariibacter sp. A3R04]MBU3022443.1 DUF72 domain-containing protein [Aestuariibacter sp. A3R04]
MNSLPPVYIGLPQWQHNQWPTTWHGLSSARTKPLYHYARQLNSIEGNTTFYALPEPATVARWYADTPDNFRFTFKLHQSVTHNGTIDPHHPIIAEQCKLLSPLSHKLGVLLIQLPASFSPSQLDQLGSLLAAFPTSIPIAVEVRHLAFFAKDALEARFNRLLIEHNANRIIMDTRGLFSEEADNVITTEVRHKKPKVPVNVIATHNNPIVRFVGGNSDTVNEKKLLPWVRKCHQWRCEGKSPYLFFHRPDNADAPWLAQQFICAYNRHYPDSSLPVLSFPDQCESSQTRLF